MCPYARFQSAMFDQDTLIVTYDEARGEPRGARSKKAEEHANGLGSCIDCNICVQVCPTGIDIRNGLQYECIGCGACIDACDDVMDKMGYAKGLIKYSTQHAVDNQLTKQQVFGRMFRPRVLAYTAILAILVVGMSISLYLKTDFRVDVLRDRSVLARMTEDGKFENVYTLKLDNQSEQLKTYRLNITGLSEASLHIEDDDGQQKAFTQLRPFEARNIVVALQVADGAIRTGSHTVYFEIRDVSTNDIVKEKSVFIMPSN